MNYQVVMLAALLMLAAVGCTPNRSPEVTTAVGELKVELTPVELTYSIRQGKFNPFPARFRITNLSSTPCSIAVWSCSYFEHWRTDSKEVSIGDWSCDSNILGSRLLTATNDYNGDLPLVVKPTTKGRQITLRLAFSPATKSMFGKPLEGVIGGTYWSNEIKITVTE